MAKMTEEQKAEMARLKAIPNDKLKDAIAGLNEFLKSKELPELEKAPNKTEAVAAFMDSISGLIESGIAEEIPEDVASFFNDYIVVDEEVEEVEEEKPKKGKKPKKDKKDKKEKPKKDPKPPKAPGIVQHIIEAYIDGGCESKKDIIEYVEKKFKVSCSGSTISNVTCVLRHVKDRIK